MHNDLKSSCPTHFHGHAVLALIVALFIYFAPVSPSFAPTLLTFDDLPAGTNVTNQFGTRGVVFQAGFIGTDFGARSGTRALRSVPPNAEVFQPIPIVMFFTSPQARVSLFAMSPGTARKGILQAFDSNGGLVDKDEEDEVAANAFTTKLEVKSNQPRIVRAVFQLEGASHYAIDDLEFDGTAAQPPPPPPQVAITAPTNDTQVDFGSGAMVIAGTVSGEGLLTSVTATIEFGRPPEQQNAPVFTSTLPLSGTGTTRQFTLPGGFNGVPLGPIKVTIVAENFAGAKGTATSTITNLPAAIRQRAATEGAAALGPFRFGVVSTGCRTAVYQNAAISATGAGNQTFVIRGEMLPKWIEQRDRLGCPSGEARPRATFGFEGSNWCIFVTGTEGPCEAPTVAGQVQKFAGGRINSTAGIGTFYVPGVFVDAIEKRGGEAVTGVPLADPTSSVGPMRTWLFQRFFVPELPKRLPSTLEIRGTPARLYMERQSGHLNDPHSRLPIETTGTIWEHFPCANNLGPCTVEETPKQPPPIADTGNKFCFGKTIKSTLATGSGPRAWEPILGRENGDHVSTPLFGVVTWADMADEDLTLAHEWCYSDSLTSALTPFNCLSDWIYRIRPYGEHKGTAQFGTLYGGTVDNTTVKVEYERFYADMVIWLGLPAKRDLMFTAGRWVIDCGHDTFKTELHPIFMFSRMSTVTSTVEPFTGIVNQNPFGGTPENPVPATQANIWVNGWYPGDPIEFDIFPPPRPHPDATLVVNKPIDAQAAFGINFESKMETAGAAHRVHIRITAPFRKNVITSLGEMKWQSGRGYEGQWFVHWSQ